MTFRKVLIFFCISLFCAFLAYYLITQYSPFDLQKVQELIQQKQIEESNIALLNQEFETLKSEGLLINYLSPIAIGAFLLLAGGVVSAVIAFHLSIEKLFFRKFYEEPDFKVALRRALIIGLGFAAIIALQVLGYDNQFLIFPVVIGILIEFGFYITRQSRKVKLQQEPELESQE
jgi:hypothetical protein